MDTATTATGPRQAKGKFRLLLVRTENGTGHPNRGYQRIDVTGICEGLLIELPTSYTEEDVLASPCYISDASIFRETTFLSFSHFL